MGIGTEPAIPQHEIANFLNSREIAEARDISWLRNGVRAERSSMPVVRSKRSPATWPRGSRIPSSWLPGWPKWRCSSGSSGIEKLGAVDEPDPMPEPSRCALSRGSGRGGDDLEEPVVDPQREVLPGLAIELSVGDGPAAEVDDVLAGCVPVKDLEQEQVDRGGRVEDQSPPGVARLANTPPRWFPWPNPAAISWRSRSRMGMIRGGMGGLLSSTQVAL